MAIYLNNTTIKRGNSGIPTLAVMCFIVVTGLHTFIFFLQRPQAFQIQMRLHAFLPIA